MSDEISGREPLDIDTGPRGHVRPLLLVGCGGAAGSAARASLSGLVPDLSGVPLGILCVNVVGAFLLGWLIEVLARGGPDIGRRRDLRLLLGAGVLGGFTTYSALAVDAGLLLSDRPGWALAYGAGSIVLGVIATTGGILAGRKLPGRVDARA